MGLKKVRAKGQVFTPGQACGTPTSIIKYNISCILKHVTAVLTPVNNTTVFSVKPFMSLLPGNNYLLITNTTNCVNFLGVHWFINICNYSVYVTER